MLPLGSTGNDLKLGSTTGWGRNQSNPRGQATSSWHTGPLTAQMSGNELVLEQELVAGGLWACARPQREGRASPRQVSTALQASQVPSQALGAIFLSSPPTASCFPPQSLHLPGPSLGQLAASQKTLQSGAQLTDRNTEAHQFLPGRLLVSGHISALAAQHFTSRHASLSQEVSTPARLHPTPPPSVLVL